MAIFIEVEKNSPKTFMEPQKPWIAKTNMSKNKAEVITFPNFKLYYKLLQSKQRNKKNCIRIKSLSFPPQKSHPSNNLPF